jgi:hypothetical protein
MQLSQKEEEDRPDTKLVIRQERFMSLNETFL